MAFCGRLHVTRPHLRGRGGYEPPDADRKEPARTERALRRAFRPVPPWVSVLWAKWRRRGRDGPETRARRDELGGAEEEARHADDSAGPTQADAVHEAERAGDLLETLPMWTMDANHHKGTYYVYVQAALQLAVAAMTGLLYAHPFKMTTVGGGVLVSSLIALQAALCIWVWITTANDLYTAVENLVCYLVELAAMGLILASNILSEHAGYAQP